MEGTSLLVTAVLEVVLIGCILSAGCATFQRTSVETGGEEWFCGLDTPAQVTRIVDGDTLQVQLTGGREERVRILGIDTPETGDEGNMGGEYAGITDPSHLTEWGNAAEAFAASRLEGESVHLSGDCQAGDRDRYGRLLAYVTTEEGTDFGALLLREGYARTYTAESFSRKESYLAMEMQSRNAGIGLWQKGTSPSTQTSHPSISTASPVSVATVHYDASGDDRNNTNDEYILLTSGEMVNLAGWTLTEGGGITYTFGAVSLPPGSSLVLHAGTGTDSTTDLYWGLSSPVLGNDADSVILRDADGRVVETYCWGE